MTYGQASSRRPHRRVSRWRWASTTSSVSTAPTSRISTTRRSSATDITAVLAKHEFSAATMADGYSRSGAGLGVVAATSGGGCLNTVPGLGEAFASRVPVLALIGQAPTTLDGRGCFQDTSGRNGALDAQALFSAVSVYCRRVTTPEDIITALPEAVAAARTGGPAVLLLPKDIQQAECAGQRRSMSCTEQLGTDIGDPHPIARALRRVDGPGHDHRRRTGRPRRCPRRTRAAAGSVAGPGGLRSRRQGCRRHARDGIVVRAGRDWRDGASRASRTPSPRARCAWWSAPGCR